MKSLEICQFGSSRLERESPRALVLAYPICTLFLRGGEPSADAFGGRRDSALTAQIASAVSLDLSVADEVQRALAPALGDILTILPVPGVYATSARIAGPKAR